MFSTSNWLVPGVQIPYRTGRSQVLEFQKIDQHRLNYDGILEINETARRRIDAPVVLARVLPRVQLGAQKCSDALTSLYIV